MVDKRVVIVVKNPFEADLLTTDEGHILTRGASRPPAPVSKPTPSPFTLPLASQCIHVETKYDGLSKLTTYVRCHNSHKREGGWLCAYHDRVLLDPYMSKADLAQIGWYLSDRLIDGVRVKDHEISQEVIHQDQKAIQAYPVKRFNRLRVHLCPTPPMLSPTPVDPSWETVDLEVAQ